MVMVDGEVVRRWCEMVVAGADAHLCGWVRCKSGGGFLISAGGGHSPSPSRSPTP